jgi:hypothetical protein
VSELDLTPWQRPETVPASSEWSGESPFATETRTANDGEALGQEEVPATVTGETLDLEYLTAVGHQAAPEELFEAEEFARHAVYQAITGDSADPEVPLSLEQPPPARPRILTTAQLRAAWHDYECAKHRMVRLRLFGRWDTPVNPVTADAWRALERALTTAGYQVHRAWVYNCRDIAGQHTRSLHAYGLAIDIDDAGPVGNVNRATPDRREVRFSPAPSQAERCADVRAGIADTCFTPAQVAAVEAIRTAGGQQVFAWGGRWRTTKDTMHFQINVTPGELAGGISPDPAGPPSGELSELLEAVPYEALGGYEPELDPRGWAGENQLAVPNWYGHVQVSSGGFGQALLHYAKEWAIHDDVFSLLKKSPTFMGCVKILDGKYLDGRVVNTGDLSFDGDGVISKGSHAGGRLIYFVNGVGSVFQRFGSPDNGYDGDVIRIERAPGTGDPTARTNATLDTKGWMVQRIAHEATHAARRLLGQRAPGKTAAERIRAAIGDESETRKTERLIIDEIKKKSAAFAAYQPDIRSPDPGAVERDIISGDQRRTYLEEFVLGELLTSAAAKLTSQQIRQCDEIVGRIALGRPPYTSFLTLTPQFANPSGGQLTRFRLEYPNVRLALRVIDARWRSVADLDQRDILHDPALETMRQEHAKAFFGNLAQYTALP